MRPGKWEIDRTHPLAQGLAFLSLLDEKAGRPVDAISRSQPSTFGAAWSHGGITHSGTGKCAEWTLSPCVTSNGVGTGDFTFFAYANPIAESTARNLVSQKNDALGSPFQQASLIINAQYSQTALNGRLALGVYNTSARGAHAILGGLLDGQPHLFVGLRRGNNHELYFDGNLLSNEAASNVATGISRTGQFFAVGSPGGATSNAYNRTIQFAGAYNRALSPAEIALLADRTDPLLGGLIVEERPVLYFDMGGSTEVEGPAVITAASTISASGSKQATSPATVTASASVGMGGVKGAVASLNIVGTLSIGTDGIKSTSSPATITATAEYGASGIKTIIGIDKEGPAVITASATVGMGGVKGGVGAAVLGTDSAVEAGGAKGATGQAWFAAMGEFYASRGPDEVPITADEIGRAVSLQARNYSAVLAKRNYTARL